MNRAGALAVCLLAATCGVGRTEVARAADEILDVIPDNALGFAVIRNMQEYSDDVDAFARLLQVNEPGVLDLAVEQSGLKRGVEKEGSIAWVLVPRGVPHVPPAMLYILPIRSHRQLLRNVPTKVVQKEPRVHEFVIDGNRYLCRMNNRGKNDPQYAVFAQPEHNAALEQYFAGEFKAIKDEVAPLDAWSGNKDVYFVVTPNGIRKHLTSIPRPLPEANPQVEQFFNVLQSIVAAATAREGDFTLLAFGTRLDPNGGVTVSTRAVFAAGNPLAEVAADLKGSPATALSGLPDEEFALAVGGPAPAKFKEVVVDALTSLEASVRNFQDPILQEQARTTLAEGVKLINATEGISLMLSPADATEPLYSEVRMFLRSQDANSQYRTLSESAGVLAEFWNRWQRPPPEREAQLQQNPIAGQAGARLTIPFPGVPPGDASGRGFGWMIVLPFLYPQQAVEVFLAPLDQRTVALALGLEERIMSPVDAVVQARGLIDNPEVRETLDLLPANAQGVLLVDLHGLGKSRLIPYAQSLVFHGSFVPAFPEAPPVGVAFALTQDHLDVDFAAPNGVFEASGEFMEAGNSFVDLSKILQFLSFSGLGPPFLK